MILYYITGAGGRYPNLTSKERRRNIKGKESRIYYADWRCLVCKSHDGRAPDYDIKIKR